MQQSFDLTHPLTHKRDPQTSRDAERSIIESGSLKSHNEMVAWLVARYPGKTASELAELAMTHYKEHLAYLEGYALLQEVRRRLSCMNGIHVRRGTKDDARKALLTKAESVWWPR